MKLEGYPFALPSNGKKAMRPLSVAAQSNRSPRLLISFCGILSPVCRPNEPATMTSLWRRELVLPTRRFRRIGASTISPAAGNRAQDLRKIKGNQFFWQTSYIDPFTSTSGQCSRLSGEWRDRRTLEPKFMFKNKEQGRSPPILVGIASFRHARLLTKVTSGCSQTRV